MAYGLKTAFFTGGLSRIANGSAVQNDSVAEVGAFLGRENFSEFALNFLRLLEIIYQTEAV